MTDDNTPGWGATVGVYILCLFVTMFFAGIVSMTIMKVSDFSGYSVGGILSWIAALVGAKHYRSTREVGKAVLIAVGLGIAIGMIAGLIGPVTYGMRYGS